MTDTTQKACETPTAKQQRVWDNAAPGYDKQIACGQRGGAVFGGERDPLGSRQPGGLLVAVRRFRWSEVEPPVGIEPTTFSLRVRRSAD